MRQSQAFGHEQIVTELIRGVLDTVADNPNHSPERREATRQTVVCSLMSYNPRDAIETMLAGQCIVYDAVMRDGARDLLRGQAELIKIKARPGILAAGKIYLDTTEMIVRMQGRALDQLAFARPLQAQEAPAEVPAAPVDTISDVSALPAHATSEPDAAPVEEPSQPAAQSAMDGAQEKLTGSSVVQPAGTSVPNTDRPDAPPLAEPLSETVDDRLLEGFTPEEQRDIREAIAGAARLANQAPGLRRGGRP
jgi:hypothetical protein